jgi:hypothetical protein
VVALELVLHKVLAQVLIIITLFNLLVDFLATSPTRPRKFCLGNLLRYGGLIELPEPFSRRIKIGQAGFENATWGRISRHANEALQQRDCKAWSVTTV